MKHVLFVTYGGGHVNAVLPLIEALRRRNDLRLSVLGLTAARAKLEAAGFPCLGFRDFVQPGDEAAVDFGRGLAQGLRSSDIPPDESAAYLGLSYDELSQRLGREAAAIHYRDKGRGAFLPIVVLRRILERLSPDLVIATNSPRAERAAIIAAGQLGIPSMCLVDMFGFGEETEWLRRPDYASRVCVLADFVRDYLVEQGRNSEDIVVTGNPAFDSLADPALARNATELRSRQGWEGKHVVLWASEWSGEEDVETKLAIDDALIAAAPAHPDWAMAVRFHPNEPSRAGRFPKGWTISTQADDLGTLLSAVDAVVVFSSTVGLQAALLGKRLVTYRATSVSHTARYDEVGLAHGCWKVEQLVPTIERALDRPAEQGLSLPRPGNATGRILAVIDTMLGHGAALPQLPRQADQ